MKILVAPDSFKNCMTAIEAAEVISNEIGKKFGHANVVSIPLSDGGEGFNRCIVKGVGGKIIYVSTFDALLRPIKAQIGIIDNGKTIVIETAEAAGLQQLLEVERNPLQTTTYGVGVLIKYALELGCNSILLGIGGSATIDAGVGIMQALGVKFFNRKNELLKPGRNFLKDISRIDISGLDQRLKNINFILATDVQNPLSGDYGAARIYGPQKGADPEMVLHLEGAIDNYANLLESVIGKTIRNLNGMGAGGGIPFSMHAMLSCSIVSGFEVVKNHTSLVYELQSSQLVITGEGKLDKQTGFGKAPYMLSKLCRKYNIPCIVFAGKMEHESNEHEAYTEVVEIEDKASSLSFNLANGKQHLSNAVKKYFANYKGE